MRAQTLGDWECRIVDDGSTDRTAEIAQQYADADARFRVMRIPKSGPSEARNMGFAQTDPGSKYVIFMDSDDVWLPEALETLSRALEGDPAAVGAHGLADEIDQDGNVWNQGEFAARGRVRYGFEKIGQLRILREDEPTTFENVIGMNTVYPPGLLMVRRGCQEKAGLFDRNLPRMQDWDMVIRVTRQGPLRFVNRIVVHYRRHTSNLSGFHATNRDTRHAVRALHHKTYFSPENSPEQRELVRRVWRSWQIVDLIAKLRTAKSTLMSGKVMRAARILASTYTQIHRYLRGYPTLSGF